MNTIKTYDGQERILSDEIYEIIQWPNDPPYQYEVGTQVRLISGIDGSKTPGYHFSHGFVTVCRVGAETAEFIGLPRSDLKLV